MKTALALASLALLSAQSVAQTKLTYTGMIYDAPDHVGQAVTFQLVTSDNPSAAFNGTQFIDESLITDVDLFNSFSGTDITGAWTRPSTSNIAPYSKVRVRATSPLWLIAYMGNDDNGTLGVSFFGSGVKEIYLSVDATPNSVLPSPGSNYATLLAPYYGTYAIADDQGYSYITTQANPYYSYYMKFTSLTISAASPVPEPSTYGLALGGLALVAVAVRRRAKRA